MSDARAQDEQVQLFEATVWDHDGVRAPVGGFDLAACLAAGVSFARVLAGQPDETLARAVQVRFHDDPAFVELFVNRYQRLMAVWGVRSGLEPGDADDLASEVMAEFLRTRLAGYDPCYPFGPYLRRVVANRRVSWARRRRPVLSDGERDPPGPDSTALAVLERELAGRLSAALLALEPTERQVIEFTVRGLNRERILAALAAELVPDLDRRTLNEMLADLPSGYKKGARPALVASHGAGPVAQLERGLRKVYAIRFQARRKLERLLADVRSD